MQTTYQINANELDQGFIESVKAMFKDKEVEITITVHDETEYLLSSEENKQRLLQAIDNIRKGNNLIEVNPDDFQ